MRFFISVILILNKLQTYFLNATVVVPKQNNYCQNTKNIGYLINFPHIKLPDEELNVKSNEGMIRLQLCRALKEECNHEQGYSICLTKNKREIGIGKTQPNITEKFGELFFSYTGDQCSENDNYRVEIQLICDLTVEKEQINILEYNNCTFKIKWRSVTACSNRRKIKCNVEHNDEHYDLSKLINLSNDNYEIHISSRYSVILNICHSILNKPKCKLNSAACLIDNNLKTVKSLGKLSQNLIYNSVDGSLLLKYTNGTTCFKDISQMETTITFICDLYATDANRPQYTEGVETCHYKFTWRTAYACNKRNLYVTSLEKPNEHVLTENKETDVIDSNEVDLKNISLNKTNSLIKAEDCEYQINICWPFVLEKISSCINKTDIYKKLLKDGKNLKKINLGYQNENPKLINNHSAGLIYHNGSICEEKNTRNIESYLLFLCDIDKDLKTGIEDIKFKKYSNCTYFFECKTNIVCQIVNGSFYDNCFINNTINNFKNLTVSNTLNSIKSAKENKTYKIYLCGDRKICQGSQSSNSSIAEACINIICNANHLLSEAIILKEEPCYIVFVWQTSRICSLKNDSCLTTSKSSTSFNVGVIASVIAIIIIVVFLIIYYLVNTCTKLRCMEVFSSSNSRKCSVRYSPICCNTFQSKPPLFD